MESSKKAVPSRAVTGMCKKIMATSLAMLLLFSLMPVSLLARADDCEHTWVPGGSPGTHTCETTGEDACGVEDQSCVPSEEDCTVCEICDNEIPGTEHDFSTRKNIGSTGDTQHDFECENCTARGGAEAHSESNTSAVAADCTVDLVCDCGYRIKEGEENHTPSSTDCTKCTECNISAIPLATHNFNANPLRIDTTQHNFKCADCAVRGGAESHTPGGDDGDCTTAILCTVCSEPTTAAEDEHITSGVTDCETADECGRANCTQLFRAAGEHDFSTRKNIGSTGDTQHDFECANCTSRGGDENHSPSNQSEVDDDCTVDLVCDCGYKIEEGEENHTPSSADCTKCTECTIATIPSATHNFNANPLRKDASEHDFKCADCAVRGGAEAHDPDSDDGDCTTAILCTVCSEPTTAAEDGHITSGVTDCTLADECGRANCTQNFRAAGSHTSNNAKAADCTVDSVCTTAGCGAIVETKNTNHTASGTDCTKCTTCTIAAIPSATHDPKADDCRECDTCGKTGLERTCTPLAPCTYHLTHADPVTFTVKWNVNGGSPAPTQTSVDEGGSIAAPAGMTRANYTFGGWFTDAALTKPATFPIASVSDNMEFWAKWTENAPPSAPTPFVTVEDYVAGLYLSILGRPYDQGGFDHWVAAIRSGAMTAAEVELAFMFSEEAKGLTANNNEAFIESLYEVVLGRPYDSAGKASWLAALESEAMSREEIYEAFTSSLEYEHLRAETYVKGLYEAALGREYDEGGLASWTDALKTGKITATELVRSFIFSDELLANPKNDDDEFFVETLYKTFFGRASDAGGKTSWVGALTAGMARVDVFNSFASSQEFDYVCKAYGLVK